MSASKPWTCVCLISAVVAGGLLRGFGLFDIGLAHFDEGVYAFAGAVPPWGLAAVEQHGFYSPPLYPALIHFVYRCAGAPVDWGPFAVSVVASLATIPAGYALGRRLGGARAGLLAAWLLALDGMQIAFARAGLTDAFFTFLVILALVLAERALSAPAGRASLGLTITAGLAAGCTWNTKYHGFLPIVLAAGFVPGIGWTCRLTRLLWIAAIAAACYLPWAALFHVKHGYLALVAHQRGYYQGLSAMLTNWERGWSGVLALQNFGVPGLLILWGAGWAVVRRSFAGLAVMGLAAGLVVAPFLAVPFLIVVGLVLANRAPSPRESVGEGEIAFPIKGEGVEVSPIMAEQNQAPSPRESVGEGRGGGAAERPSPPPPPSPIKGEGEIAFPIKGEGVEVAPIMAEQNQAPSPRESVGEGEIAFPIKGEGEIAFPTKEEGEIAFPTKEEGEIAFPIKGEGEEMRVPLGLAWTFVWLVSLPALYSPYLRLWLPTETVALILLAAGAAALADHLTATRRLRWGPLGLAALIAATLAAPRFNPGSLLGERPDGYRKAAAELAAWSRKHRVSIVALARPPLLFYLATNGLSFRRLADDHFEPDRLGPGEVLVVDHALADSPAFAESLARLEPTALRCVHTIGVEPSRITLLDDYPPVSIPKTYEAYALRIYQPRHRP